MSQIDAYLDPATGDLPDRNYLVTGLTLIRQRLLIRMKRWRGEWFLDITAGLPFEEWLQMKPPRLAEIVAIVRAEVADVPGIVATQNFSAELDTDTRTVRITGDFITDDGSVTAVSLVGTVTQTLQNGSYWAIYFSSPLLGRL